MKPEEMTQEAAIDLLKQGKDAWHEWLEKNRLAIADDFFMVLEMSEEAAKKWMEEHEEVVEECNASVELRYELRFFIEADLSGFDLQGFDLCSFILSGANLSGANLSGAKLLATELHEADLRGANLSNVKLHSHPYSTTVLYTKVQNS